MSAQWKTCTNPSLSLSKIINEVMSTQWKTFSNLSLSLSFFLSLSLSLSLSVTFLRDNRHKELLHVNLRIKAPCLSLSPFVCLFCGISSGSILFTYHPAVSRHINMQSNGPHQAKTVPLSMRKMCAHIIPRMRKVSFGSPFTHSVVSSDFISNNEGPDQIRWMCSLSGSSLSAYARRHVFAWRGTDRLFES